MIANRIKAADIERLAVRLATSYRPKVPLATFLGLSVYVDERLPPGQVEIRDSDGAVISSHNFNESAQEPS